MPNMPKPTSLLLLQMRRANATAKIWKSEAKEIEAGALWWENPPPWPRAGDNLRRSKPLAIAPAWHLDKAPRYCAFGVIL